MNYTMTDDFNRILEVQQSKCTVLLGATDLIMYSYCIESCCLYEFLSSKRIIDVVAGIATNKEPEYIEEMINKQAPLVQVLRLLCLYSLVNSGLKPKQFEFFKREILETYGFEHIQTLENLRRLGMLTKQVTTKNTYGLVRRSLSLIVDEVNEHAPNDISYVYSGYAPLSVRLVQCVVQRGKDNKQPGGPGGKGSSIAGGNGWKGFEDVLRMLPGRTFDETQRVDDGQPRPSKSKFYVHIAHNIALMPCGIVDDLIICIDFSFFRLLTWAYECYSLNYLS